MKWIVGLLITVIVGPLIVFALTRSGGPLNPADQPAMGGSITQMDYVNIRPCCTYSVKFSLSGFKGETATMDAIITDAVTGRQGTPRQVLWARPEADTDQAAQTVGVPITRAGQFYVIFILRDPNGTELDRKQTRVITVG